MKNFMATVARIRRLHKEVDRNYSTNYIIMFSIIPTMLFVLNISLKRINTCYNPQVRYLQQKLGTAWFKEVAELEASITRERSGTNRIWKTTPRKKKPSNHSLAGTTMPVRPSGRVQTVAMLGESTTTCMGESSYYRKVLLLACLFKLLNVRFMVCNFFTSLPLCLYLIISHYSFRFQS